MQRPAVFEKQPVAALRAKKRSWEKETLIIGAGIGAVAGGVGGLIYDAITRDKS